MSKRLTNTILTLLAISLLNMSSPVVVQAQIIGTLEGLQTSQRDADLATLNAAFAREEVRTKLSDLGVEPAQVEARLAALTDSELNSLAADIESAPAGAGVIEVIGIVFIVLIILEAVGVTDIFKKFP